MGWVEVEVVVGAVEERKGVVGVEVECERKILRGAGGGGWVGLGWVDGMEYVQWFGGGGQWG